MITNLPEESRVSLDHIDEKAMAPLARDVLALLNLSGVDMGRETHYNTKEEQEKARTELHRAVFERDRSIYGCMFCLPGTTDFSKQKAVTALLSNRWDDKPATLTIDHENKMIQHMLREMQANRMINLFVDFDEKQINNSRTRKVVLRSLIDSKSFDLWSVKYRSKIKRALIHVWNKKTSGVIQSIVRKKKEDLTSKEWGILNRAFPGSRTAADGETILECVKFIFGACDNPKLPIHRAFHEAKQDLSKGKRLPMEVLEGIRGLYHKDVPRKKLFEIVKDNLTTKQKRLVQKSAKKAGVKVDFDPMRYPMTDLYIYAFEMGWTKEIARALGIKAKKAASTLPFKFGHVGVLLDNSQSMRGSDEQKLRPMATALATKDLIACTGDKHTIVTATMDSVPEIGAMTRPRGPSDLAGPFLELLKAEPDSIFIISDGYENAPEGRLSEVLQLARHVGIQIPVYHINPVSASESKLGIRVLDDSIPVMPINKPEAIGLTLFKAMLETDPRRGLESLVGMALPILEKQKEVTA